MHTFKTKHNIPSVIYVKNKQKMQTKCKLLKHTDITN